MLNDDGRYQKLLEELAEIKATTASIERDIFSIKAEDAVQNQLLAEHILGVKIQQQRLDLEISTRTELLKEVYLRLQMVEFVPKLVQALWKMIQWTGIMAASVVAITKLLNLW